MPLEALEVVLRVSGLKRAFGRKYGYGFLRPGGLRQLFSGKGPEKGFVDQGKGTGRAEENQGRACMDNRGAWVLKGALGREWGLGVDRGWTRGDFLGEMDLGGNSSRKGVFWVCKTCCKTTRKMARKSRKNFQQSFQHKKIITSPMIS